MGRTFSEKLEESFERTVYSWRAADGTTSTGPADIVEEGLPRATSRCLSLFLARQPLKGHTLSHYRTDSFVHQHCPTSTPSSTVFSDASDTARHSPSPHTHPRFATPSLSPSTNLLLASLLGYVPTSPLFLYQSIHLSVHPSFFLAFLNFRSSSRALRIFYLTFHAAFYRLTQRTSKLFPIHLLLSIFPSISLPRASFRAISPVISISFAMLRDFSTGQIHRVTRNEIRVRKDI